MRRLILILAAMGIVVFAVYLLSMPGADQGAPGRSGGPRDGADQPHDEDPSTGQTPVSTPHGEISGIVWLGGASVPARVELRRLPASPPDEWFPATFSDTDGLQPAIANCVAGQSGSFLFRDLEPGRFELRAKAGGAVGAATVEIRLPGERARIDITIPAGPVSLSGRAVYSDGSPFEGFVAAVTAGELQRSFGTPAVRPDEEGRFSIPGLDEGTVRVTCNLPGKVWFVSRRVRVPHPAELVVVVDGGTTELTGRVLSDEDGAPVPGAEVTVTGDTAQDRKDEVRVYAGEDGSFAVRVLPIWRTITVHAKGFSPVYRTIEEGVDRVDVRLGRAGAVLGTVLSADDRRPLAGITVRYRPIDSYHPAPAGETTSDANGRYAFDSLPNCEVMLYAAGGGWISPGLGAATDDEANPLALRVAPGSAAEVDIEVVRAFRVSGRVLDDRGEGATGIVLETKVWQARDFAAEKGARAVTDQDGRFAFDALVPDVVHGVWAQPPGRAAVLGGYVSGSAGESAEMTIRLQDKSVAPRWLDLLVVEMAGGKPIPGAKAYLGGLRGRTDSSGRVRLGPLPSGRLELWVHHPYYMLLENRPTFEEAAGVLSHTLKLRRGLAISGRVLLPDGRPLENGTVWAKAAEVEGDRAPADSAIGGVTADGIFRVSGLLAGKYALKIGGTHDRGGYWAKAVVPAGQEGLVLTAERYVGQEKRTLIVSVLGPDGKPVPGATLDAYLSREDYSWEDEYEVHDGEAMVEFWEDGLKVIFAVSSAHTSSGAPLPFQPVLLDPASLRPGEQTIRLSPGTRIEGVVVTKEGKGVRGVRVEAVPTSWADRFNFENPHAVAYTDGRGAFLLSGLCSTEYSLALDAPETYLPVDPVLATPGSGRVRVELIRGAEVHIEVVDEEGSPISGAWVKAGDITTVSRADGRALIRGLDPAEKFTLLVKPPTGRHELLSFWISDWSLAERRVVLREGGFVSGVVTDEDGAVATGCIVLARGQGGSWQNQGVARDGSFRFGPYESVHVELAARWKVFPHPKSGVECIRVPVGSEGVALTIKSGRSLTLRILNWNRSYGPARARLKVGSTTKWAVVSKDGLATFPRLPETGEAGLWIGPVGDGYYLLMGGIGEDLETVEASLLPGGSVSGRLILPRGARDTQVRLDGTGYSMRAAVAEDGNFSFTGVPKGKCVVTAQASVGGRVVAGHQWTETGGTVEIEVEER